MIKSDKKITELVSILSKNDKILIGESIDILRNELPFKGAIGLLTSFYNRIDDVTLRKKIEEFMNDLKDQAADIEVITEIKKDWKPETLKMLVSSCWQSGLDYSAYCKELAEVFLKSDYIIAFECLTVIEESIHKLSSNDKIEIIDILKNSPAEQSKEKEGLLLELMTILSR